VHCNKNEIVRWNQKKTKNLEISKEYNIQLFTPQKTKPKNHTANTICTP
jgi:hypothetical protein